MSNELELPDWARYMANAPQVTKYCGAEEQAVPWYARTTRDRYSIWCDGQLIDLNQQQACAIAEMLTKEIEG